MSRVLTRPRPLRLAEDLERARVLDRTTHFLTRAVHRVLSQGRVKDLLHGVPLGHPAHPPLTDVPVGCWLSAAVLDLAPGTERASQALVATGLLATVPTVLTGVADQVIATSAADHCARPRA